jgi:hypothetical protein
MPCRTQPHQPDSSPPPVAGPAALTSLWKEGSWEQAEAHRWLFTRSGTAGALHQNSNTLGAGCKVVIFTRSGGHLSKLGMIRAEVKDGSESADIHG